MRSSRAIVILVALMWGCGNSLLEQDGKNRLREDPAEDPVDEFEVIEDVADERNLPVACNTVEDCDDKDPCTQDICALNKCVFVAEEIAFTQTWIETAGSALDVDLSNGRLTVAEGEDGVEVFSIADIRSPQKLGHLVTTGSALSVEVTDSAIHVSEQETGHETFNKNLEQTSLRVPGDGPYSRAETIEHIVFGSKLAIVSAHSAGVVLTKREDSSLLGVVNTAGRAVRAAVGDEAFGLVADSLVGAISVVFGSLPSIGGKILTMGRTVDVAVSGDTGLMAEYGAGFGVLDLSDPSKPQRLARVPSSIPIIGVELIGPQTAVVVEETGGKVTVYSLIDPFIPEVVATWDNEESEAPKDGLVARNIETMGDLIAVAMDRHGVLLLEPGCSIESHEASD